MALSHDEILQMLKERELIRDFVQHPGAKLLADKLRAEARKSLKRQLDADPYTQPDEIQKNKQFRYVVTVMLPGLIESIANFDPLAADKKVAPAKRWSILEWFRK